MKVKSVLQADLLLIDGIESQDTNWVIVMESDPDYGRLGAEEKEGDETDIEMEKAGFTRYGYNDLAVLD